MAPGKPLLVPRSASHCSHLAVAKAVIQQQKGRLRFLGLKAGSAARVASLFQFLNKTSSLVRMLRFVGPGLRRGGGGTALLVCWNRGEQGWCLQLLRDLPETGWKTLRADPH